MQESKRFSRHRRGLLFPHLHLQVSYGLLTKCGNSVRAFSIFIAIRTDSTIFYFMNYKHIYSVLLLLSTILFSCSSDEPNDDNVGKVSKKAHEAIKAVFPNERLDSIKGYGRYVLKYNGNLLASYIQSGDGGNFEFKYSENSVFVTCGESTYEAIIGDNGYVSTLICPNGKVNHYTYDEDNHLVEYDANLANDDYYSHYFLTWENGNVKTAIDHHNFDGSPNKYADTEYEYVYDNIENTGGLLTPYYNNNWISDCGLSRGYGINEALYYAGLLGIGTKNLVRQAWVNTNFTRTNNTYNYNLDENGYVISFDWYENRTPREISVYYSKK